MTEAQADEIEAQWSAIYDRQRWLQSLQSFGVTERDLDEEKTRLSRQLEQLVSDRDVAWSILNALVANVAESHTLKMLYHQMAIFLAEENKDFRPLLTKAAEIELLHYKQSRNIKRVRILAADKHGACKACLEQDGAVYTIEEAMQQMPIPCTSCENMSFSTRYGFCRCMYQPVID